MKKRIRNIIMIAMIIMLLGVACWNSDFTAPVTTTVVTTSKATATTIPTATTITPIVMPSPVGPSKVRPRCTYAMAGQMALSQENTNGFIGIDLQPLQTGKCIPVGVKVIDAGDVAHVLTPSQGVSTLQGESPLHLVTQEQMTEHLAQGLSSRDFLALELQDGTMLYFAEHGSIRFKSPLNVLRIWTGNNSGAIRFSIPGGGSGLIDTARYWDGASIQSLTGQGSRVNSLTVYIAPVLLHP